MELLDEAQHTRQDCYVRAQAVLLNSAEQRRKGACTTGAFATSPVLCKQGIALHGSLPPRLSQTSSRCPASSQGSALMDHAALDPSSSTPVSSKCSDSLFKQRPNGIEINCKERLLQPRPK